MFSDKNADEFPELGFPSSWKKSKSVASNSSQTHPIKKNEAESQVTYYEDVGTQTSQKSANILSIVHIQNREKISL